MPGLQSLRAGLLSGPATVMVQATARVGAGYERLPSPTQYYYVNQGPTFSGPGNFAPVPTYQESAVSGWNAYSRPYYYPYDGGRYANAMHHYYDGAPVTGPAMYSYRWNHSRSHHGACFALWRSRRSYGSRDLRIPCRPSPSRSPSFTAPPLLI